MQPQNNRQRIAFVTGGLKLGGSTTFLCNLGGELVRRGLKCAVFSFEKENPLATDFTRLGIDVFVQDESRTIWEDSVSAILRGLADYNPTSIVANLGPSSFEVLRYVPTGIKRVGIIHSDDVKVYRLVTRYRQWLDAFVGVSSHIVEQLGAIPEIASMEMHCLTCGVGIPSDQPTRFLQSDDLMRIIYLGRLDHDAKRVRIFPDILKTLAASGVPFHWSIVGDGPERGFLEKEMTSSHAGQTIKLTGRVAYERIPELLQSHHILLLTSDYEGLPLSLLEAMACGLVPVVSDLPSGIREVVDTSNGILVPVNDIEGYSRGILHLLGHREEWCAKSDAARARVQAEFSTQAIAPRWLEVLAHNSDITPQWSPRHKIDAPLSDKWTPLFWPPLRPVRRLMRLRRRQ